MPNPRAFIDPSDISGVLAAGATSTNAITAFSGGGQTSAVLLTTALNRITTVAAGNDSVKLPPAKVGNRVIVANKAASNSANVYPSTGDAINAIAANSPYALAATKTVEFFCMVDGTWDTLLTA